MAPDGSKWLRQLQITPDGSRRLQMIRDGSTCFQMAPFVPRRFQMSQDVFGAPEKCADGDQSGWRIDFRHSFHRHPPAKATPRNHHDNNNRERTSGDNICVRRSSQQGVSRRTTMRAKMDTEHLQVIFPSLYLHGLVQPSYKLK